MSGDIVLVVGPDPARPGRHVLRLGTSRHEFIGPDSETFGPGAVLDLWVRQLDGLTAQGGTAMLPYNFSDQCTGWLRATSTDGSTVELQAGWSLVDQYRMDGEDYAAIGAALTDFEPIRNARVTGPLADIIALVRAGRDDVE